MGSSIPLMVVFPTEEPHALDVLAKPGAIQLKLRRSMATGLEATDDVDVGRTTITFKKSLER